MDMNGDSIISQDSVEDSTDLDIVINAEVQGPTEADLFVDHVNKALELFETYKQNLSF